MLARAPLQWPVGLFQLRFPPWLKALATQLVYNLIFLSIFLLDYRLLKMLAINVDSANVTCTTSSLSRKMLTTKLFPIHFAVVGVKKLWEV